MFILVILFHVILFRFDGLSQAQGKDWYGSEAKIKKVIKEKLGIENLRLSILIESEKKKEMTVCSK